MLFIPNSMYALSYHTAVHPIQIYAHQCLEARGIDQMADLDL